MVRKCYSFPNFVSLLGWYILEGHAWFSKEYYYRAPQEVLKPFPVECSLLHLARREERQQRVFM